MSPTSIDPELTSRRRLLCLGAGVFAWAVVRPAAAADSLAELVEAHAAGGLVQPGKVDIDIEPRIDNGNTAPITITVDSPMTTESNVQSLALFGGLEPQGLIARFELGPRAGHAQVSLRIRVAASQTLVAIARMNDGSLWSGTVDLTIALAAHVEG